MNKKKSLFLLLTASALTVAGAAAVATTGFSTIAAFGEGHTHELNHYDAYAPTETAIGKNREYWICCGCHKMYSDADGLNEITGSIDLAEKTTKTQTDAPADGDLITTLVNDDTAKLKGLDQTDWDTYTNGKGKGTVNYYDVDGKKAMFLSGSLASNSTHKSAIDSSNSGYAEFRFDLGQASSVTFDYKYYDIDSSVYGTENHTLAQWYDGKAYSAVDLGLINDNQWHTITVTNTTSSLGKYFVVKIHHFEGEIFLANMSKNDVYDYNTSTAGAELYNVQSGSTLVESGVSVVDDKLVYSPTTTYEHYEGVLPRVNYSRYGSVGFTLEGNANYGFSMEGAIWNESTGIHGSSVTVQLSVNLLPANKLFITATYGDVTLTSILEDSNVASGLAGLPFYFSVSEGDTSMKVSLPTLAQSNISSDNVGQIKFVKGGAHNSEDEYVVSGGAVASSGAIAYTPDLDYTSFEVTVPAVDFSKYGQATYPVYFLDANYGVSLGSKVWNESTGIHGLNLMTTLNVAKISDTELEVTLSDGTTTFTSSVTDADVIAGNKGVSFFFSTGGTKAVYVMNPTLISGHTHNYVATTAVIGGQVETACSVCGLAGTSRAYEDSDLDYSKFTFGADLYAGWSFATNEKDKITVSDGKLRYGQTTTYASGKLILPHVNFDVYSKVEFSIETKAYYGINLTGTANWNEAEYRSGTVCNGKLEVIVNGTNSLTVNFYDTDASMTEAKWTESITDADVYTGASGIPFWANIPEGSDYVLLSLPTLTSK